MSETFTKLFSSITDSTIWIEDNETRLVWITMLAMADRNGYVGASVPGLAARARVSVEATRAALNKFLSPDPDSRTKDHEGRRIEEDDRGWTLLNYHRFRDMRDEEARKEYERVRKRRQRESSKSRHVPDMSAMSLSVTKSPGMSAQAEAEADPEAEKRDPDSLEPGDKPGSKPAIAFTFPVVGKANFWAIGSAEHLGLVTAFPGVTIPNEYPKVLAWLIANPTKRKTPRGMPRFLFSWMERAQNRTAAPNGPRSAPETFAERDRRIAQERANVERERVQRAERIARELDRRAGRI